MRKVTKPLHKLKINTKSYLEIFISYEPFYFFTYLCLKLVTLHLSYFHSQDERGLI